MPDKDEVLDRFLAEPLRATTELSSTDIPLEPGVYAWYRQDELFYVGETHRGLRGRVWSNHLRGNARGSTLRNKVAKSFGFQPVRFRAYGPDAEAVITDKLLECAIRLLTLDLEEISPAQAELISALDPAMNDHPTERPRWRIDEVRNVLGIVPVEVPADGVAPDVGKPALTPRRRPAPDKNTPGWDLVERALATLARSGTTFPTITGKPNRIVDYEPGRRVLVETETGENWVQVAWIMAHWQTLTRKGEVTRDDVLAPGRRAAFMLGLFLQVPGVREIPGPPARVRLDRPSGP